MGQTLDRPITEKTVVHGQGNGLRYGLSSMHGWRVEMEDAHTAIPSLKGDFSSCSYYAVFDGHAGSYTSSICSQRLHDTVLKHLTHNNVDIVAESFEEDASELVCKVIRDAFVAFDEELKISGPYKSLQESCGTTAVGVFITPHHIIFCNCGDSRGFLARNGMVYFQTKDHKPSDADEKARIEASGGGVVMDRVNGNLAVSRALGDFSFKDKDGLDPRQQAVSPEPCVTIIKREEDDFIVLACDGIWDVMTCEEVRHFVDLKMKMTTQITDIASELIDTCLMKDSRDNMSVIIVALENAPKVCKAEAGYEIDYENQIKEYIAEHVSNNDSFTLQSTLQDLVSKPFLSCAASELGVYAKLRFVEAVLNDISPHRNKDRDYSSSNFLGSFPMSLRGIKSVLMANRSDGVDAAKLDDSPCEDTPDSDENVP